MFSLSRSAECASAAGSTLQWVSGCFALLHGPPKSGRTSFAFQTAYDIARKGTSVYALLRDAPESARALQFLLRAPQVDHAVLRRIQIKTVGSHTELRFALANLHLLQQLPGMIIVDGFESYFPKGPISYADMRMKTLAVLQNTHEFLSEKLDSCTTIVVAGTDVQEHAMLYRRLFSTEIAIQESAGDATYRAVLRSEREPGSTFTALYEVSRQQVTVLSASSDSVRIPGRKLEACDDGGD